MATKLDPSNPEIAILHSQLLLKAGDNGAAIRLLTNVTEKYPEFVGGHLALSSALLADDQTLKAGISVLRLLALDPNHVRGNLIQSNLDFRQGNLEAAEARLVEIIERAK